jgi:hypothetical protein
MLVELVRAGLTSVTAEPVLAGDHRIEVARLRITEAGRRALGQGRHHDPPQGHSFVRDTIG